MDLEAHSLLTSRAFASDDTRKAIVEVIDEHYPSIKNECLHLLQQLLINDDRNLAALALQDLGDRAPLIAYPLIRQAHFL